MDLQGACAREETVDAATDLEARRALTYRARIRAQATPQEPAGTQEIRWRQGPATHRKCIAGDGRNACAPDTRMNCAILSGAKSASYTRGTPRSERADGPALMIDREAKAVRLLVIGGGAGNSEPASSVPRDSHRRRAERASSGRAGRIHRAHPAVQRARGAAAA